MKLVIHIGEVGANDLFMSAMYGLCSSSMSTGERSKMIEELYRRLRLREGA